MEDSTSNELNSIQSQIEAITKFMETFQSHLEPLVKQQEQMKSAEVEAYQEYQNKIAAIRTEREAIDNKMFEVKKQLNEQNFKLSQLKHQQEDLKKKAEAEAKQRAQEESFKSLQERWDKLTAGAPWREWAMDHQISGAHKITADMKVIVADPMGLGKTLTAIASCDMIEAATKEASAEFPFLGEEKEVYKAGHYEGDDFIQGQWVSAIVGGIERPVGRKILYFCPAPMIKNVEAEFRMWAPHRNVAIMGGMTKKERDFIFNFMLKPQGQYVVICNYEAWRKDLSLIDSFIEEQFDTIIIDEAHIVKDTKSIAYRGIKKLIDTLKPEYVIPMTGTPILNRPQELFSLLTLVNPEKFYNLNDFLYRFCEQDAEGHWRFIDGGIDLIAKLISKNFMRRTREMAGIKLPPKTITKHIIQVDTEAYPHQAKAREHMKKYAMLMIDEAEGKAITAAAQIAVYTRLRQIETWPAGIQIKDKHGNVKMQLDVEESQKLDYLIRYDSEQAEWTGLIPEVIEDERSVVFSQFKAPLRELRDRIERMGKRAVVLDGETPADIKEQIRLDFDQRHTPDRSKAKWDVVLCNYKVGGVGMNLTAATQMFIVDEEWNPGKRDQAYDRIHRIGQDKPVTIHVLRDEGTVDNWLANIMEKKELTVDQFNSAMTDPDLFKKFLESDDGGSGLL